MLPCWAVGRRNARPRPVAMLRLPVASRLRRASGRGMQPMHPQRRQDPRPVPLRRRALAYVPSPTALKWHRIRRSPWPASSPTSIRDNGASAPPACHIERRPTTAEVTKARESFANRILYIYHGTLFFQTLGIIYKLCFITRFLTHSFREGIICNAVKIYKFCVLSFHKIFK